MDDIQLHAIKLVNTYKQKRAMVLSKRKKLIMNTEDGKIKKLENYKAGLSILSETLINVLKQYNEIFTQAVPEISCYLKIKSKYPEDLDIIFSIKNYSLRFLSRKANTIEEFQGVLIDGMLYVESAYKGKDKKTEAQIGLWSDIAKDAWGVKGDEDDFLYFFKDILPELIESFWNNATIPLIYAN